MTRKFYALPLCLIVASALSGCSMPSFGSSKKSGDAFGDGTTRDLAASNENYFTKTFKQAGAALTPKPKVEKAPDPTALATKTGPMGPDLHLTAARQYESQGQFLKAEAHYKKALEIAPKNAAVQIAYARLLHRAGKIPEAVQVYQKVIAENPNSAVALNDLGLCHARHGQIEAARQALTRAVQLKPESALYRNNLATVLVEANRFEEALAQLQAAHGEAGAHYNMGFLMQERGNAELAAQHFARAGQLDPSLAPAQVAQENPRLRVETVSQRTSEPTYYVGDANAENAPYPEQAPPVMVER